LPNLIDSPAALEEATALLAQHDVIACDTESDSFFAYRPRVCLIQFSVPGEDLLLDPLADFDLAPLGAVLGDPKRTVIFHAAENDIIQLNHELGWRMGHLFDTQIASFVLGEPPYSLAGVLETRFGVKLDKSQQRSDWSRRPLSKEQLTYASEDTAHLIELYELLHGHAEAAGRMEEIDAECTRIANREWEPTPFDPEGYWRMKASRDLDPWGLRILRGMYLLRHEEADRRNRAPYRIANDSVLVTIARERATRPGRGIPERFWGRYGKRIAGIVRSTENGPTLKKPRSTAPRAAPDTPETKERYEKSPESATDLADLIEPFRDREYGEAMLAALLA